MENGREKRAHEEELRKAADDLEGSYRQKYQLDCQHRCEIVAVRTEAERKFMEKLSEAEEGFRKSMQAVEGRLVKEKEYVSMFLVFCNLF